MADGKRTRAELRRRRRPGSPERETRITASLVPLVESAKELRPLMGKLQWPQYDLESSSWENKLRDASYQVRLERQKLRKMQR